MMRLVSVAVWSGLLGIGAGAYAQKPAAIAREAARADKAARAAEQRVAKQAQQQAQRQVQRQAPRPVPRPGELAVDKLAGMTPAQREKALAALPAERRQKIEKNLEDFQKLPPAQQERARERLEMLNSLPPQRQVMVRQSMREFNQMPQDRKQAINREMRAMAPLSGEERRARLNSDEFRAKFSPVEQDTMGHLVEVLPRPVN